MKLVFADTAYWVALINRGDQLHKAALQATLELANTGVVTTDLVLVETLNFFSEYGPVLRQGAVGQIERILQSSDMDVVITGRLHLMDGVELYRRRLDKEYSLTDCISMLVMRDRGISEVLTHDKHFKQEGFVLLLQ